MNVDRRGFAKSLTGVVGALAAGPKVTAASPTPAPASLARAQARLAPAKVTRIRVFYPPNYNPNGPQAFPQSNMVVLVDTDAGITGIGQGGSPDTVRNVARSVIGKNAFDTEMIWQAAFMDGFYSPGKERLHALGAIDLALWDIKGKALNVPLYQLFGGKAREHIELYATSGLPQGLVPPAEAAAMGLKERAAATMAAGYRVYRVDSGILPSTARGALRRVRGAAAGARRRAGGAGRGGGGGRRRLDVRFEVAHPADHPGGGADPRGHRPGRQLDDRPAPEVRLPRGGRSLPAHGAVPAVLRRGPGSRRAVPDADPEAAAADDRAAGARRGVGDAGGLQSARRAAGHRLRPRVAAERRRHHGDAQDHGRLRYPQGRHRAALHRARSRRPATCTR